MKDLTRVYLKAAEFISEGPKDYLDCKSCTYSCCAIERASGAYGNDQWSFAARLYAKVFSPNGVPGDFTHLGFSAAVRADPDPKISVLPCSA